MPNHILVIINAILWTKSKDSLQVEHSTPAVHESATSHPHQHENDDTPSIFDGPAVSDALLIVSDRITMVSTTKNVLRELESLKQQIAVEYNEYKSRPPSLGATPAEIDDHVGSILSQPPRPRSHQPSSRGNTPLAGTTVCHVRVIDCEGKHFVCPGFTDSHVHLLDGGRRIVSVQLQDVRSKDEFIFRMMKQAEKQQKGTWIRGGQWYEGADLKDEWPVKEWIDAVTPDHPVAVTRIDNHCSLLNSLALKICGITKDTPVPHGGEIEIGPDGEPTGILKDTALKLVRDVMPFSDTEDNLMQSLFHAQNYLVSKGVTSCHVMGTLDFPSTIAEIEFLHQMDLAGKLRIRIYTAARSNELDKLLALRQQWQAEDALVQGEKGKALRRFVRIGCLKAFLDGSLGSHTLATIKPYRKKDCCGLFVEPPEELRPTVLRADKEGVQCCVHAIGDLAVHEAVNLCEELTLKNGPRDRRFRIEHCQHVDEKDVPRIAKNNIIPSIQPLHLAYDGHLIDDLLGEERSEMSYPFQTFHQYQITCAFGSDWMVVEPDVMKGVQCSVERTLLDGSVWHGEQSITREQALIGYTYNGPYSVFQENELGELKPGYLADIVILDRDPLVASHSVLESMVLCTIVGGVVKHEVKNYRHGAAAPVLASSEQSVGEQLEFLSETHEM